jgi:hypothetical protein
MTKRLYLLAAIVGMFAAMGLARNSFAGPPITFTVDLTGQTFTNPCNGLEVTATSGSIDVSEQIIDLPDGTMNVHIRESTQGVGTDTDNNVYKIGGIVTAEEVHSATESIVEILRFHSKTGASFVSIIQEAELRNNEPFHEKNLCVGNN